MGDRRWIIYRSDIHVEACQRGFPAIVDSHGNDCTARPISHWRERHRAIYARAAKYDVVIWNQQGVGRGATDQQIDRESLGIIDSEGYCVGRMVFTDGLIADG